MTMRRPPKEYRHKDERDAPYFLTRPLAGVPLPPRTQVQPTNTRRMAALRARRLTSLGQA